MDHVYDARWMKSGRKERREGGKEGGGEGLEGRMVRITGGANDACKDAEPNSVGLDHLNCSENGV